MRNKAKLNPTLAAEAAAMHRPHDQYDALYALYNGLEIPEDRPAYKWYLELKNLTAKWADPEYEPHL